MDETAIDYLKEIQGQLKRLNSHLNIMMFCMVAVTITLIAEVLRHW